MGEIKYTTKDVDRFWSHVKKTPGCWEWESARLSSGGYGAFRILGKTIRSHRFSWAIANGSDPGPLCVLHECDNPPCVNPEHLRIGTIAENNADRERKGRGTHPNPARGTRNGAYTHPERVLRGDSHWSRKRPELVKRGEDNGFSKLTKLDVEEIRSSGRTGREMARKFNVTEAAISAIRRRKTWNF